MAPQVLLQFIHQDRLGEERRRRRQLGAGLPQVRQPVAGPGRRLPGMLPIHHDRDPPGGKIRRQDVNLAHCRQPGEEFPPFGQSLQHPPHPQQALAIPL